MKINIELEQLLKECGLSDVEFAEKVGIHYSQLSRYKTGKSIPRTESIEKIQKHYPDFLKGSKQSSDSQYGKINDLIVQLKDDIIHEKNLRIAEKDNVISIMHDSLKYRERVDQSLINIHKLIKNDETRINLNSENIKELRKRIESVETLVKKSIKVQV